MFSQSSRKVQCLSQTLKLLSRRHSSNSTFNLFDRPLKKLQRNRAASDVETSRLVDYLRLEVGQSLCERLSVVIYISLVVRRGFGRLRFDEI
jgi:hypothetical protein